MFAFLNVYCTRPFPFKNNTSNDGPVCHVTEKVCESISCSNVSMNNESFSEFLSSRGTPLTFSPHPIFSGGCGALLAPILLWQVWVAGGYVHCWVSPRTAWITGVARLLSPGLLLPLVSLDLSSQLHPMRRLIETWSTTLVPSFPRALLT